MNHSDLGAIAADVRSSFERDGFATIPNFVESDAIARIRRRAETIVDAFDPSEAAGVFSTRDDAVTKSDAYFLTSGSVIRCFLEEEAVDGDGRLLREKHLAINKIGHALHDLDPVFADFSHDEALERVARAVGLERPAVYQSMYIFKQPGIGGEVRWHQDATYFVTQPHSVVTFWFALEDARRDNGCLWVERGGHRGPLRERFSVIDGLPRLERLDAEPWPSAERAEALEVDAGTLVVFHGLLPHYSAPNRSSVSRHAYTLHVVDALAHYAETNWLQRPATFPARGFASRDGIDNL
jgi:phytanoyl-CoA hydroxylase